MLQLLGKDGGGRAIRTPGLSVVEIGPSEDARTSTCTDRMDIADEFDAVRLVNG